MIVVLRSGDVCDLECESHGDQGVGATKLC
jgi:hypothetical protein